MVTIKLFTMPIGKKSCSRQQLVSHHPVDFTYCHSVAETDQIFILHFSVTKATVLWVCLVRAHPQLQPVTQILSRSWHCLLGAEDQEGFPDSGGTG